jgi:formaldehyde-activating enzyme involved in methanogenesis
MSTERKLIVGLADEAVGRQVANVLANVSAGTNRLGFFGSATTVRPTGVTLNNVTAVANALANLGLIATTTP